MAQWPELIWLSWMLSEQHGWNDRTICYLVEWISSYVSTRTFRVHVFQFRFTCSSVYWHRRTAPAWTRWWRHTSSAHFSVAAKRDGNEKQIIAYRWFHNCHRSFRYDPRARKWEEKKNSGAIWRVSKRRLIRQITLLWADRLAALASDEWQVADELEWKYHIRTSW